MTHLGRLTYLRPCRASDDAFLYDVFCTTWQSEVAALPNQNLAQHVLRIQHIAQERKFAARFPDHERYVIVEDGEPAGRLYLTREGPVMHLLDLTLVSRFRSRGIGKRVLRDLCAVAEDEGCTVSVSVGRRNRRVTDFYNAVGFRLTAVDDLDNHFEWAPVSVQESAATREFVEQPDHAG